MTKLSFHTLLITLIGIVLLLPLAACDKHEDIDRAYTDYRYDIVTYLGQNGAGAVFEYLGHGDSAAIKLQSRVGVSEVETGQRVLLRYDFADDNTGSGSREVDVFACSRIISDSLRVAGTEPAELPRHAVKLRSLWRTGDYINLHCQVEYTGANRTFWLAVDMATADNDTADCYLVHDLRGERGTFWRDCYASFNVGALWHKSSLRCLRVHLNDETYPDVKHYDFNKKN